MDYRTLAKCTCGSIMVYSWHEDHGNIWVHWRPTEDAFEEGFKHELVEGSQFIIYEDEFEDWNDKSEEELRKYLSSMNDFWKETK